MKIYHFDPFSNAFGIGRWSEMEQYGVSWREIERDGERRREKERDEKRRRKTELGWTQER